MTKTPEPYHHLTKCLRYNFAPDAGTIQQNVNQKTKFKPTQPNLNAINQNMLSKFETLLERLENGRDREKASKMDKLEMRLARLEKQTEKVMVALWGDQELDEENGEMGGEKEREKPLEDGGNNGQKVAIGDKRSVEKGSAVAGNGMRDAGCGMRERKREQKEEKEEKVESKRFIKG
ncbi:MAG: hypothetical protein O7C56_08575 [Rickettsia endosymbiont of Ixodes persulcatus]|nr:hypothetical protein [Rickettsia endosymbiont of Ixodes persulcatus]